jgi:hypothetical protein
VGDAFFALALDEIEQLHPEIGDAVTFIVHGLSLWDEAI